MTGAYRLLLRMYPASFRHRFGAEMAQVFAAAVSDEGIRVWPRTIADVVASAPALWIEETHVKTRLAVAAFFAVAVGGGTMLVIGSSSPAHVIPVAAAVGAGIGAVFGVSALVGRFGRGAEHDYATRRPRWWWALAALGGLAEVVVAVRQLVEDPKIENVAALVVIGGFAALIFGGMAIRNRRVGNWLIATGMLPFVPFVWFPPAPIAALVVIVAALSENIAGARRLRPSS